MTGDAETTPGSHGAAGQEAARNTRPTVIWNASAGRKLGLPTNASPEADDIRALFAAHGLEIRLVPTSSEEEAREVAREAAGGTEPVVAAGGDGTVRLVAGVLLDEAARAPDGPRPPLGILPLGSVMNVARSLGIPRELPEAASIVAGGTVRAIDVGEVVGSGPFFEGVTVGLHAELFAAAAALDEGDVLAPLRAAVAALRYKRSRLTLELGGGQRVHTRSLVTFVANGPYAGLGFTVAPAARLDDGLLDVRVFDRFSRLELLAHFWSIAAGRRRYEPRVRTYRSASVTLRAQQPLPVRVDGTDLGMTPVELGVRRAALRVLVPGRGSNAGA